MPVPACRQPVSLERLPDASRPRQKRSACWTIEPSSVLTATSHNLNLCEELIKNIGIHDAARGPYRPAGGQHVFVHVFFSNFAIIPALFGPLTGLGSYATKKQTE